MGKKVNRLIQVKPINIDGYSIPQKKPIKVGRTLIMKLDPYSDRYRICPHCKDPFMTSHRSTEFCCQWCHDEYWNRIKEEDALLKKLVEENNSIVEEKPLDNSTPATQTDPTLEIKKIKENNFKILEARGIGYQITKLSISGLSNEGFIFGVYDLLEKYPALSSQYFMVFGDYWVLKSETNEVTIFKKK